jgi:uncharacterized protein YndB with AHSA1/START domain
MRYALIGIGVIVVAVLVIVLIGWTLPVKHVASRSVSVSAPPDSVFALISRAEDFPRWRTGVTKVDIITDAGKPQFREHGSDGELLFEVMESNAPRRLVTRIADPSLPFGGRWIYEITPTATGSELRITEEGEVYNPIFRFVSRFMMGHTRTIDRYLADLTRQLEPR